MQYDIVTALHLARSLEGRSCHSDNSHWVQEMAQISGHNGGNKSTVSVSTVVKVRPQGKWQITCVDYAEGQLDGKRKALNDHGSPTFQTPCHYLGRQ